MKKILFFGLLAVFSFNSCDDEDNPNPDDDSAQQNLLIGVWSEEKFVIYSGIDKAELYSEVPDDCAKQSTVEYKTGGVVTETDYADYMGACTLYGSQDFYYAYHPDYMTIVYNGQQVLVYTLTLDTLEVKDIEYQSDYNGDGVLDTKIVTYKK